MNIIKTNELMTVRQHGAMEYTTPPCDLDEVRRYRLQRVRAELRRAGAGADHPVLPSFEQGRYLSCLTLVVGS